MLDLDSRQAIACAADHDALCQTGGCAYLKRLGSVITYQSDEIEPFYCIAIQEGKLVLERLKSRATPLEPAIMDLFTSLLGSLRFTRDPGGKVTGCILNRGRVLGFRFKELPS